MQTGYFSTAWHDIKSSPGWFGKLILLSLIGLIPIFGWIVVLGYLYGWARDIAWNVHTPLPQHVFGNEDGRLYSRGFFALVIAFVCMLAPWVLELVWGLVTGAGAAWTGRGHAGAFFAVGLPTMVISLVIIAASVFATLFSWVGSMRMSVYGRLGAGFQFGKIWAMIRHDFGGLVRILGMAVLLSVIVGIVLWLLMIAVGLIGLIVGFAVTGGNMNLQATHPTSAIWGMIFATGGVVVVLLLVYGIVAMAASVFVDAVVVRALGYWTRQFDVPMWRGQEDPMPFELVQPPLQRPPYVPPTGQPPMQD